MAETIKVLVSEEGKRFFVRKYPEMKYLAYFQAYTNTYGDLEEFKQQSADYAVLYFLPDVAYAISGSLFMGYQITAYIPVPVFQ